MSIGLVRLGFFFHGLGGRGGREGCGTWVDGQAVILIADDDAFTCLLTIFFFFFFASRTWMEYCADVYSIFLRFFTKPCY